MTGRRLSGCQPVGGLGLPGNIGGRIERQSRFQTPDRFLRMPLGEGRPGEVLVELRQRAITLQAGFESLAGFGRTIEIEIDVPELVVGVRIVRIDLDRPPQARKRFLVALLERQQACRD